MSELRERRPGASPPAAAASPKEEEDKSKVKPSRPPPDLEPNPLVLAVIFAIFTLVLGGFLFYKVDNAQNGDFANWVNTKFPAFNEFIHRPHKNPLGAEAAETTGQLSITEADLKAYDGTDPDKPIYLAINGTIFDVSASPAFYGPGGHYHHFVGQDASRAWITECWDSPDQFTWRLDGVEKMFHPRYLDELFEDAASGEWDPTESDTDAMKMLPKGAMLDMAKEATKKVGKVSAKEREKRRAEDQLEAASKAQETLAHWYNFFNGNAKYENVGNVVLDQDKPAPPALCAAAMKKQPMKNGMLEKILGKSTNMPAMGKQGDGKKDGQKAAAGMPDFVKRKIEEGKKAAAKGAEVVEEVVLGGDDGGVHDEL